MRQKKKIFVAGGTGFLGKRLIKKLKQKGYPYVTTSLSLGVDFRNFDQTLVFLKKSKPDVVIHAATYVGGIKFGLDHAGEVNYYNTIMTAHLIEASRIAGVEKFISPISNCSYPDVVGKDFKEDEFWDGPMHPSVMAYGIVRKLQYIQTWAYARQYGMKFVNLILPNMYGPEDHFHEERSHALGALLMKIVEAKKQNKSEVVVWGSGKPVREWLYIDDGAEALIKGIDVSYFVEPINIGVGKGISIKDLAFLIKEVVGYKGRLIFDKKRPDGAPYKVMNVDRCKKVFNWFPETDLKEGIQKTYEWYMMHKG